MIQPARPLRFIAHLVLLVLLAPTSPGLAQSAQPAAQAPADPPADPHAGHVHDQPAADRSPSQDTAPHDSGEELPPFIPRLTDDDRRAAFPDVEGHHAAHDRAINYLALFEQAEWQAAEEAGSSIFSMDATGWVGRDRDRLWFRADGDVEGTRVDSARVHALYGRQFSRWWDVVGGVRQDAGPGAAQTWAAFGVQGLAPYWFEVEATAYVSTEGTIQTRLEAEYDLRVTNRWIVRPLARLDLSSREDLERDTGAGLSSSEVGFRLRYLVSREFAPYVGVIWRWKESVQDQSGETGESSAHLVAGLRVWF